MMHVFARSRGFTLIELVVSLTVSAVIIGMAAMILTGPTDAYMDAARRGAQTDSANFVVSRLTRDLERALPNSVRINANGNRTIIEMLVYEGVGFYRRSGDLGGQADRELSEAQIDSNFSLFGRLDPAQASPNYNYLVAVANSGQIVGGINYDAYRPNNRVMTPNKVEISVARNATLEEGITLSTGFRFQNAAAVNASQRVFFVSGPVTYICNTAANAQTLRRFENYSIASALPTSETNARLTAASVKNELIADSVSACRVRCQNGNTSARPCRGGLVVELTINRRVAGGDEAVRIFRQFPVDNRL
jgi:MSHA biogenesis protein MshO